MRIFLFLIIMHGYFEIYLCWTGIGKNPENYNGKGCKVKGVGELNPGEVRSLDEPCSEIICTPPDYKISGCAAISGAENCELVPGNSRKPYPHCCPSMECTKKD